MKLTSTFYVRDDVVQISRELLGKVRATNEVVRCATDGLLRHMRGMVQMVTRAMSVHGTYGRQGMAGQPSAAAQTFSATG